MLKDTQIVGSSARDVGNATVLFQMPGQRLREAAQSTRISSSAV